jgi:hypothetical protein
MPDSPENCTTAPKNLYVYLKKWLVVGHAAAVEVRSKRLVFHAEAIGFGPYNL